MRNLYLLLAIGLLALLLSGCGKSPSDSNLQPGARQSPDSSQAADAGHAGTPSPAPSSPSVEAADRGDSEQNLLKSAHLIADMLRSRDLDRLKSVIDSEHGLLFSPYAHIDKEQALTFTAETLPTFQDTDELVWGAYDGSGEPIELTFREYFEMFVYDQDFAGAPEVNVNKLVSQGNAVFNGLDVYPDASYVEFHYPGFEEEYEGMDWVSLILVMRPDGEDWKLSAIVHSQWTI